MTRRRSQAGFTLAELIVVLAVLAILAVFAAPAALDWWRRETVIVLADHFVSTLSLAQATARNQRVWVRLAPLDAAQGWSSGWALYTTPTSPCKATWLAPGADDVLITASPRVPSSVKVAFKDDKSIASVCYTPVGYSRTSTDAWFSDTLTLSSGSHVRRVPISKGFARICDPAKDGSSCGPNATDDDS